MKIIKPKAPEVLWKRNGGKDIKLNVTFKNALLRFAIVLFLPLLILVINKHSVIYTTPIELYLIISAISRFCVIKYMWRRFITNDRWPVVNGYGKDVNYPEESL